MSKIASGNNAVVFRCAPFPPARKKLHHRFAALVCFQAAAKLLDEMCLLTAQSLTAMNTSEHFEVLKLLGEGSYGKVMLAVHRKRGADRGEAIAALKLTKQL